jgi:hypothetical protein
MSVVFQFLSGLFGPAIESKKRGDSSLLSLFPERRQLDELASCRDQKNIVFISVRVRKSRQHHDLVFC